MIWVGVFVFFFVLELLTVSLVSIWFCAGAAVAGLVYLAKGSVLMQVVAFFVTSVPCLLIFYPISKRLRTSKTNVDTFIGAEGIVTEKINPVTYEGRVKVRGQDWAAMIQEDDIIDVGTSVVVTDVQGVRLIVTKKEKGD